MRNILINQHRSIKNITRRGSSTNNNVVWPLSTKFSFSLIAPPALSAQVEEFLGSKTYLEGVCKCKKIIECTDINSTFKKTYDLKSSTASNDLKITKVLEKYQTEENKLLISDEFNPEQLTTNTFYNNPKHALQAIDKCVTKGLPSEIILHLNPEWFEKLECELPKTNIAGFFDSKSFAKLSEIAKYEQKPSNSLWQDYLQSEAKSPEITR